MFQIVEGNSRGLKDVDDLVDLINDPPDPLQNFFDNSKDVFVARAPGRLDVMGGIADYSGSLVMPMPIAEATFAAVQKQSGDAIEIFSIAEDGKALQFKMNIGDLKRASEGYDSICSWFSEADRWASYIAGVFFVLNTELECEFTAGVRILINSKVPIGKGVSSSAAVEVSTMQAICAAFEIEIEPRRLAILCQLVENRIVGAACGIMDQMAVNCGTENALVSLLCQPATLYESIKIPDDLEFWGIDSGVHHSVSGSDYSSVRAGAFMGYRMIAHIAGLDFTIVRDGVVTIDDARWNGYLSNITPQEYEASFEGEIPVEISGRDFLKKYIGTTDTIVAIDLKRKYFVKAPTEHGIFENHRVKQFAELLKKPMDEPTLEELGELMYGSHAGYAACGLNEGGTDLIVEMARERKRNGVFGARITGGGSGGTVSILTRKRSRDTIESIAKEYAAKTRRTPYVFSGSSPGCSEFGHLILRDILPANTC
jgi:galactokinase